ncbi:MAG: hypothetical protein HY657_07090 [Acidobacteria bacterium]|nr:hypothetical protein [Acidobacteriota bacterium]
MFPHDTDTHRPDLKADVRRALAALVLLSAFVWSLLTVELLNDHFDRISRGRQILVEGEQPFSGFRDPGYFLTLYTSAAAQAVSGGSLIGEAVINSAAIAAAVAFTFILATHAASSTAVGIVAALFTVIVPPRYYDYDKVLFYTSGLVLAWRYADGRALGTLIATAVVTAVAGLFRYDNGAFLFVATITTLFACHWREPGRLFRRTLVYGVIVVVTLAPVAMAWQQTIGLSEVARQIFTYAQIEGARTQILTLPRLRVEAGQSVVVALVSPENRAMLLYFLIIALLPVASAALVYRVRRPHGQRVMAHDAAKIAASVVLGALVAVFILRDPVRARLGSAAPIAAILAAWLAGPLVPSREARSHARPLVISLGGVAALYVALVLTGRSPADLLQVSRTAAAGLTKVRELTRMPPSPSLLPDADATEGMVTYVRACTPRGSRVLVDGFVPQLYFFAERGFAGGMPVFFGGHWSSVQDQDRIVEQLRREFVPLAIIEPDFAVRYDRVGAYLSSAFVVSGVSAFDNPRAPADGYHVLLQRGVEATTFDSRWNLPCLASWIPAAKGGS